MADPEVTCAALALGSNLGDRAATLQGAVTALDGMPGMEVLAVSRVFETDPVGGPEQDCFLNAVVLVRTGLDPVGILDAAQAVEQKFARVRDVRWGPRTLDVDVLAVGDLQLASERLTLPHPRAHERAFVLVPWADADPQARIPGRGPVAELLAAVGSAGVRSTDIVLPGGSDMAR